MAQLKVVEYDSHNIPDIQNKEVVLLEWLTDKQLEERQNELIKLTIENSEDKTAVDNTATTLKMTQQQFLANTSNQNQYYKHNLGEIIRQEQPDQYASHIRDDNEVYKWYNTSYTEYGVYAPPEIKYKKGVNGDRISLITTSATTDGDHIKEMINHPIDAKEHGVHYNRCCDWVIKGLELADPLDSSSSGNIFEQRAQRLQKLMADNHRTFGFPLFHSTKGLFMICYESVTESQLVSRFRQSTYNLSDPMTRQTITVSTIMNETMERMVAKNLMLLSGKCMSGSLVSFGAIKVICGGRFQPRDTSGARMDISHRYLVMVDMYIFPRVVDQLSDDALVNKDTTEIMDEFLRRINDCLDIVNSVTTLDRVLEQHLPTASPMYLQCTIDPNDNELVKIEDPNFQDILPNKYQERMDNKDYNIDELTDDMTELSTQGIQDGPIFDTIRLKGMSNLTGVRSRCCPFYEQGCPQHCTVVDSTPDSVYQQWGEAKRKGNTNYEQGFMGTTNQEDMAFFQAGGYPVDQGSSSGSQQHYQQQQQPEWLANGSQDDQYGDLLIASAKNDQEAEQQRLHSNWLASMRIQHNQGDGGSSSSSYNGGGGSGGPMMY